MYIVCLFEQYYLRVNQANWDEIHNPHFATSFDAKKEANEWLKKNTTLSEYAKAVSAEEAIKKYDEWMKDGGIRRSFDFVNNVLSRKYNNESAEDVLEWRLTVEPDSIRYEDYATWPDLRDKFEHLWDVERYHNDDYTEKFLSVQLYFKPDSKYKTFKKEFGLVLPHVTRLSEDGYKTFSVFDHFLSEGGDYVELFYKTENDCYVSGRWSDKVRGSLKECFEYLKTERYYD